MKFVWNFSNTKLIVTVHNLWWLDNFCWTPQSISLKVKHILSFNFLPFNCVSVFSVSFSRLLKLHAFYFEHFFLFFVLNSPIENEWNQIVAAQMDYDLALKLNELLDNCFLTTAFPTSIHKIEFIKGSKSLIWTIQQQQQQNCWAVGFLLQFFISFGPCYFSKCFENRNILNVAHLFCGWFFVCVCVCVNDGCRSLCLNVRFKAHSDIGNIHFSDFTLVLCWISFLSTIWFLTFSAWKSVAFLSMLNIHKTSTSERTKKKQKFKTNLHKNVPENLNLNWKYLI